MGCIPSLKTKSNLWMALCLCSTGSKIHSVWIKALTSLLLCIFGLGTTTLTEWSYFGRRHSPISTYKLSGLIRITTCCQSEPTFITLKYLLRGPLLFLMLPLFSLLHQLSPLFTITIQASACYEYLTVKLRAWSWLTYCLRTITDLAVLLVGRLTIQRTTSTSIWTTHWVWEASKTLCCWTKTCTQSGLPTAQGLLKW